MPATGADKGAMSPDGRLPESVDAIHRTGDPKVQRRVPGQYRTKPDPLISFPETLPISRDGLVRAGTDRTNSARCFSVYSHQR